MPSGTVTVTLTQASKQSSVTGSGSVGITCDGQLHSFVVTVTSGEGTFHGGTATVSAQGSAYGTFTNQIGYCSVTECFIDTYDQGYYREGSTGPQPIKLLGAGR